jgi:hypothetical protein
MARQHRRLAPCTHEFDERTIAFVDVPGKPNAQELNDRFHLGEFAASELQNNVSRVAESFRCSATWSVAALPT